MVSYARDRDSISLTATILRPASSNVERLPLEQEAPGASPGRASNRTKCRLSTLSEIGSPNANVHYRTIIGTTNFAINHAQPNTTTRDASAPKKANSERLPHCGSAIIDPLIGPRCRHIMTLENLHEHVRKHSDFHLRPGWMQKNMHCLSLDHKFHSISKLRWLKIARFNEDTSKNISSYPVFCNTSVQYAARSLNGVASHWCSFSIISMESTMTIAWRISASSVHIATAKPRHSAEVLAKREDISRQKNLLRR